MKHRATTEGVNLGTGPSRQVTGIGKRSSQWNLRRVRQAQAWLKRWHQLGRRIDARSTDSRSVVEILQADRR